MELGKAEIWLEENCASISRNHHPPIRFVDKLHDKNYDSQNRSHLEITGGRGLSG